MTKKIQPPSPGKTIPKPSPGKTIPKPNHKEMPPSPAPSRKGDLPDSIEPSKPWPK